MALKALLLRKKIDLKEADLEALRKKNPDFETRESELQNAVGEVTDTTSAEDRAALENLVAEFEADRAAHNAKISDAESELTQLRAELSECENAQSSPASGTAERNSSASKNSPVIPTQTANFSGIFSGFERSFCMPASQFPALRKAKFDALREAVAAPEVRDFLAEIRAAIAEKRPIHGFSVTNSGAYGTRALTNVGLTVPDILVGLIRENLSSTSKLYGHVAVRNLGGNARINVMGPAPEAVWSDCCGILNELTLAFYNDEFDCYKVAGYYAVCNATLEDSDLNLASEIITSLSKSIGLALDKAIIYGRNGSSALKMPMGILTRLAQTSAPSGYPATARTWVDLHSSNIISIAASNTGAALFKQLVLASGAAKSDYSNGDKFWIMNQKTKTALIAEALTINASGAIVSGFNSEMPVIGGAIETREFIPDNVIIGGYGDCYNLIERAGNNFMSSEHVKFLADQTVFRGTARYDGGPTIAEAFVAIGIAGTTPAANSVTFAADTANTPANNGGT